MTIDDTVKQIMYYYEKYGSNDYIGENITQVEHMTQGAMMAEDDGRSREFILAVFLHDIGHILIDDNYETMDNFGIKNHESKGRIFLEKLGIPYPIPNLVENHVKTKRYLISKNSDYYDKFSEASKQTLKYQGGKMSENEMKNFELEPLFEDSLAVRYYDEKSKLTDIKLKPLSYYKELLTTHLQENEKINSNQNYVIQYLIP